MAAVAQQIQAENTTPRCCFNLDACNRFINCRSIEGFDQDVLPVRGYTATIRLAQKKSCKGARAVLPVVPQRKANKISLDDSLVPPLSVLCPPSQISLNKGKSQYRLSLVSSTTFQSKNFQPHLNNHQHDRHTRHTSDATDVLRHRPRPLNTRFAMAERWLSTRNDFLQCLRRRLCSLRFPRRHRGDLDVCYPKPYHVCD